MCPVRRWARLPLLAVICAGCAWRSQALAPASQVQPESSRILASDGSLLTTLHGPQNRQTVPLAQIPRTLQDAVVATEDSRFWSNDGVDVRALVRAAYANATKGRVVEGGSTITEQYVKNVLLGNDRTVSRKVKEASLAFQLERRYSKPHILELYLNTIYFGNGSYGVQAAADEYFGLPVSQLSLGQSALLAGVVHAPNDADPFLHPDMAAARRRQVLDRMVALGKATPAAAGAAAAEPLIGHPKPPDQHYPAAYFVEQVKRFILDDPRFGPTPEARRDLLFEGGITVTTTLDRARQALAEDSVSKVLSEPARDPAAALVSLDPHTGAVRALVGGQDFFASSPQAKFDLATQGQRPAGSSFKPFVLAAAIHKGISLATAYDAPPRIDIPLTNGVWHVDNYEGEPSGPMNLVDATVHSINTVYARLILEVGPETAVDLAARMGITTPLHAYPSAVLGTNDVTPLDMAAAYATLANGGVAVTPSFVDQVLDRNGAVLYHRQPDPRRVLDAATAATVTAVLRQVVDRGTGINARIGRPVAGKTGTGEQWRDAWFVGYTPETVTSVWVGFADAQQPMQPPATRILVTGGSWPAQIWQLYMSRALATVPVSQFPPPPAGPNGGQSPTTDAGQSGQPDQAGIVVDQVVGMPAQAAEDQLSRAGFRAVTVAVTSDQYPPGYVTSQSPPAGTHAAGGSTVTLRVATGPPARAEVPDVVGLTESAARQAIGATGLKVRVVHAAEPPSAGAAGRKGLVWKQDPPGDTATLATTTVTIDVNPA
ncbi:MAG TPA: PBP1A family penicillin-binding protein [Acidimicrobiales bacterium]